MYIIYKNMCVLVSTFLCRCLEVITKEISFIPTAKVYKFVLKASTEKGVKLL